MNDPLRQLLVVPDPGLDNSKVSYAVGVGIGGLLGLLLVGLISGWSDWTLAGLCLLGGGAGVGFIWRKHPGLLATMVAAGIAVLLSHPFGYTHWFAFFSIVLAASLVGISLLIPIDQRLKAAKSHLRPHQRQFPFQLRHLAIGATLVGSFMIVGILMKDLSYWSGSVELDRPIVALSMIGAAAASARMIWIQHPIALLGAGAGLLLTVIELVLVRSPTYVIGVMQASGSLLWVLAVVLLTLAAGYSIYLVISYVQHRGSAQPETLTLTRSENSAESLPTGRGAAAATSPAPSHRHTNAQAVAAHEPDPRARKLLIGAAVMLGWFLFSLVVPMGESYADDGFGFSGKVDVKCGSFISRDLDVEFRDELEQQIWDLDYSNPYQFRIFEGSTAEQVCDDEYRFRTIWLVGIATGVAVLAFLGFSAKGKSTPATAPAPTKSGGQGVSRSAPPETDLDERAAHQSGDGSVDQAVSKSSSNVVADITQSDDVADPDATTTRAELDALAARDPKDQGSVVDGAPAPTPSAATPAAKASSVGVLVLPSGERYEFLSAVTVGANPPTDGWCPPGEHPGLADAHARFIIESSQVWVEDLNSGGTTQVLGPEGASRIEPGSRERVGPDEIVQIGSLRLGAEIDSRGLT